jgi:hypothetical protein
MSVRRILWVGVPLALLALPVILIAVIAATCHDAWRTGVKLYDDLSDWVRKR